MLKVFKSIKDHIAVFQEYREKPVTFDSFDFNLYDSLIKFLTYDYIQRRRSEVIDGKKVQIKGLKTATVGKTIKQLCIFLRDRMRRKIIPVIDLTDFKIPDEGADAVYLTWQEIGLIYTVGLSEHLHLTKYRNLLFLEVLPGLGSLTFQPFSRKIYRFNRQIPAVTNPEFNRHIKEVAQLAVICELIKFSHKKGNKDIVQVKPKYAWITSHTYRRSFCTNEFLTGTPVELIMKIGGHKSLRDFYKYIRIRPEEAGKKIREIWEKRGDIGITAGLQKVS